MAEPFFGITDTGRVRTNNEDAFLTLRCKDGRRLACVIDGVGGYEGGEVAAAIARDALARAATSTRGTGAAPLVQAFVEGANAIGAAKAEKPALQDMACVLTAVITDEKEGIFYFAHVGDTRLYLFRDGSLVKITHDHSFVGLLEDSGRISEAEAMAHPKRNEIDRALGFGAGMDAPADYVETGSSPFLPGDLLLLCSDGLSDLLTRAEMVLLLQAQNTLPKKGAALIDAANRKGGKDNITVVLLAHPGKRVAEAPVGAPRAAAEPEIVPPQSAPVRLEKPGRNPIVRWPWIAGGLLLLLLAAWLLILRFGKTQTVVMDDPEPPSFAAELAGARDTLRLAALADSSGLGMPDSLLIEKNTLVIMGEGRRLWPFARRSVLQVAPTVSKLLLSHLELRSTDIRISTSNLEALRFDSVHLVDVTIGVAQPLLIKDTVLSGTFYLDKKAGGKHD
jgi:serine/threonine protein phosphatase PrpC